jgi:hypothetical protein
MVADGRGTGLGRLALREPGSYLIRREGEAALTAEVSSDAFDRPLALRAGRYEVTRRAPDHLMVGTFTVAVAGSTPVSDDQMRRVDFGRAVRKGGTSAERAFGIYANGALRGSLVGLGGAAGGGVGARMDLRGMSATMAVDFATGSLDGARGTRLSTSELGLRAGAFRAFDSRWLTVGVGGEIGAHRFVQTATDQPTESHSYAASAGPALLIEVPVTRRTFFWIQGALPVYLLKTEDNDRTSSEHGLHPTYRIAAAAGGYL